MPSTVTLYKNVAFKEEKNFLVEHIEDYLETLSKIVFSDFKRVKHAENVEIKIDVKNALINMTAGEFLDFTDGESFNYVSILNDDETKPTYYFVDAGEWTATGTARLYLIMDVLNTFKLSTDYELTEKTVVKREHKDRVLQTTVSYGGELFHRRNIELPSEGLNVQLFKKEEEYIRADGTIDFNWYVMFKTNNEQTSEFPPVAVEAYVLADETFYSQKLDWRTLDISGLNFYSIINYDTWFFGQNLTNSQSVQIKFDGEIFNISEFMGMRRVPASGGSTKIQLVKMKNEHDAQGRLLFDVLKETTYTTERTIVEFKTAGILYKTLLHPDTLVETFSSLTNRIINEAYGTVEPQTLGIVDNIKTVDRTDSKLIKIIKLPYEPFNIKYKTDGALDYPPCLVYTPIDWSGGNTRHYLKVEYAEVLRIYGASAFFQKLKLTQSRSATYSQKLI